MIEIPSKLITSTDEVKSALLAKHGNLKNACKNLSREFGQYIDYDRVTLVLLGDRLCEPELSAICQDLGIKPEVITGAAK